MTKMGGSNFAILVNSRKISPVGNTSYVDEKRAHTDIRIFFVRSRSGIISNFLDLSISLLPDREPSMGLLSIPFRINFKPLRIFRPLLFTTWSKRTKSNLEKSLKQAKNQNLNLDPS